MKIQGFRIENFRNLSLVECSNAPDFMVVCGSNGCGKSALLEALITAKEYAGAYGRFEFDRRAVTVGATKATISLKIALSETERSFVQSRINTVCPEYDEVLVEILDNGTGRVPKSSPILHQIFTHYGGHLESIGFFDYITAYRQTQKNNLSVWDPRDLSTESTKQSLVQTQQKFRLTKHHLASLKMRDLQEMQTAQREGHISNTDSLRAIRESFDRFFAPMRFKDVYIDRSPFDFVISTPQGEIDIDDLSSGEKEILNVFVRFDLLKPYGAIILFDEADAHLHPDLERRYLQELRTLGKGNQVILTTHSPEMMLEAGSESLYTILKYPKANGFNQLARVTENAHLHEVLAELMGSHGLISFNQRIVFIEGADASADRLIYEAFYPPSQFNVSFVPAGNSATVRKISEQVDALLGASVGFQQYFSIVDGDIDRATDNATDSTHLFRLPVYHVENLLLNEVAIYEVTRAMLGTACPYINAEQVKEALKKLVLSDEHLKPFTGAVLEAKLAKLAKIASDEVFKGVPSSSALTTKPDFTSTKEEAKKYLETAILTDTWKKDCKGRDLLKAYCTQHNMKYEHFRNGLVAHMAKQPAPAEIADIMNKILA